MPPTTHHFPLLAALSGIGIICFAGSYAIAFLLEVSRLVFRSGLRGAAMLGFAGAGLFAHTIYLYYRAMASHGLPLSSPREWFLVAAWLLAAMYLLLVYYHPRTPFGLVLLPLVLGLIATAAWAASPEPFERGPASRIWGMIHAGTILVATVAVLLAFSAGLAYLYQVRRLKRERAPVAGLQLPSLEWLERANSRSLVLALLLVLAGVVAGGILNAIREPGPPGRLTWHDPTVLTTLGMLVWLTVATALGAVYRPLRQGRKVVYLTLASFVFLVLALAAGLLIRTGHGSSWVDAPTHRRL